ncbi:hypothetical protein D3C86_1448350 [compost metagenome]
MAHIGQEVGLGAVGGFGGGLGLDQGLFGGDLGGDVAGYGVNAVAELLRPPFQGDVVPLAMAIAVDVALDRGVGAAVLDLGHAVESGGQIVGVHQAQNSPADQRVRVIAQGRRPGGAGPDNDALQVADDQQIQRHVEEGRQVGGLVARRLRISRQRWSGGRGESHGRSLRNRRCSRRRRLRSHFRRDEAQGQAAQ